MNVIIHCFKIQVSHANDIASLASDNNILMELLIFLFSNQEA